MLLSWHFGQDGSRLGHWCLWTSGQQCFWSDILQDRTRHMCTLGSTCFYLHLKSCAAQKGRCKLCDVRASVSICAIICCCCCVCAFVDKCCGYMHINLRKAGFKASIKYAHPLWHCIWRLGLFMFAKPSKQIIDVHWRNCIFTNMLPIQIYFQCLLNLICLHYSHRFLANWHFYFDATVP